MWHFSWESAPKSFQIPSSSFLSLQQFDYIWLTIFRPWQLIHMVSCVSLYSRRSGQLFLQWPQLSESKRCCPLNLFYLIPCCEDGTDSFQALLHTGVEMRRGSPQFLIMLLGLKFSLFCSVSSRENWGAVPASSPAWVNLGTTAVELGAGRVPPLRESRACSAAVPGGAGIADVPACLSLCGRCPPGASVSSIRILITLTCHT